ncbi:MFS transporter [Nocardia sp. NPDC050697]|uniref:MFS transporter n=1 Tax=Nocardia sp. NPDC050697 TaxID=3155158 RepID=UPI00340FBC32
MNDEPIQHELLGPLSVSGTTEFGDTPGRSPEHLQRVGKRFIAIFTLASFGMYLTVLMPTLFSLAYKIQTLAPESKQGNLGLVIGIGALVGLLTGPLLGAWSDRTTVRWGRRRPFLVAGIGLNLAGALTIAVSSSIAGVLAGWLISIVAQGSVSAAILPTIAEGVPAAQRGVLGAFVGVATQLAGVASGLFGSFLTHSDLLLFGIPVLVLTVVAIPFLVAIPDHPAVPEGRADGAGKVSRSILSDLRRERDYTFVLLGKFLMQMGMSFFSTYQLYFLLDRLGMTPESAGQKLALVGGIGVVVTTLSAIVSGVISDRISRRKPFIYTAAALIALGLSAMALSHDLWGYASGALLLLAGAGMFGSVDLALVSDVMPGEGAQAGKFMGIYNLAAVIPGAIAPLVAPLLLRIGGGGNYTVLFLVAAVTALGAGLTVSRVAAVR